MHPAKAIDLATGSAADGPASDAPAPDCPAPDGPTVAFVCTHNACRSQMAEALARRLLPRGTKIFSAGTKPVYCFT